MKFYFEAFKKMIDFKGRSTRKDYWFFYLFNFIIIWVLFIVGTFGLSIISDISLENISVIVYLITLVYSLVVLLPYATLTIRRLHDAGFSAWWLLAYLIPTIGSIVILILLVMPSKPGSNKYGNNPYKKVELEI